MTGKAVPTPGQNWHLVIQSPEVSQHRLVPRVFQRTALFCCLWAFIVCVHVCVCVHKGVCQHDCDLFLLLAGRGYLACLDRLDCPRRCRVSAPAEKLHDLF